MIRNAIAARVGKLDFTRIKYHHHHQIPMNYLRAASNDTCLFPAYFLPISSKRNSDRISNVVRQKTVIKELPALNKVHFRGHTLGRRYQIHVSVHGTF